jgi:hypothetical protein
MSKIWRNLTKTIEKLVEFTLEKNKSKTIPNVLLEKWRNFARKENTGPQSTQILKPVFLVFRDSLH